MVPAPKLDKRTAPEIAREVRTLVREYTGATLDPEKGAAAALVAVFTRYAELIVERLNRVPEKNFLAFLDLLGAAPRPPQPARVPLTFALAEGTRTDAIVPPRTQVAAAAVEGEKEPAVFETDNELVVTSAQLNAIVVTDPERDRLAVRSFIAKPLAAEAVPIFSVDQPKFQSEHIIYLAHAPLFGHPDLMELKLSFATPGDATIGPLRVTWETWKGSTWSEIPSRPTTDRTENLTKTGDIVFSDISTVPRTTVNGQENHWLRGRLESPIPPAAFAGAGKLPTITAQPLTEAKLMRRGLKVKHAVVNNTPVDVVKGFFPFGERPKAGDSLYLAVPEAFAELESAVTINLKFAKDATAAESLRLRWEFWDGTEWIDLNVISKTPTELIPLLVGDSTAGFTKNGTVKFKLEFPPPAPTTDRAELAAIRSRRPQPATVGGVKSFWVRVRIVSGDYGKEAYYQPKNAADLNQGFSAVASTLNPPFVTSVTVDYSVTKTAPRPEVVFAYNDLTFKDVTQEQSFKPFLAMPDQRPTLYLGFELPANRTRFPPGKINLFADLYQPGFGDTPDPLAELPGNTPQLHWEYSTNAAETGWSRLLLRDGTANLTRPGLIEFLGPADVVSRDLFGSRRFWFRVRLGAGRYPYPPKLQQVLLNTVMATRALTIRDEILGSSDGSTNQKFKAMRAPILDGPLLEVQEPELPPAEELEGTNVVTGRAVQVVTDETRGAKKIWVQWNEVPDFYGSSARDRHYVLDHLTGEVRFGDGVSGMVPPAGSGNLRFSRYRIGGGAAGNRPVGAVSLLKTTIPHVRGVTNYLPATGGADAESDGALVERAPRTIRHGDRAVTVEDYEDLARLASPEVARAKCVPHFDLIKTPRSIRKEDRKLGTVSLIIVPRATGPRPAPGLELIERVRQYLDARRNPATNLIVVPPEYISVGVEVEVAVTDLEVARELELAISGALAEFLHPLTGGYDRNGWDFGRKPHRSDLFSLLEAIPGISHVHRLIVTPGEDSDVFASDRFLVYSGTHSIVIRPEEAGSPRA